VTEHQLLVAIAIMVLVAIAIMALILLVLNVAGRWPR
jgi:preprotein translocase subunit SecE